MTPEELAEIAAHLRRIAEMLEQASRRMVGPSPDPNRGALGDLCRHGRLHCACLPNYGYEPRP